jgi:aldehyde dehydrogenase (NAD+)
MDQEKSLYIDGTWVTPKSPQPRSVINPATEQPVVKVSMGDESDVDAAVHAARTAFRTFSRTSVAERRAILERVIAAYQKHSAEMAQLISREMGAPISMANNLQVGAGLHHLTVALEVLQKFSFEERVSASTVLKQPIGVCGLICPWNWPMAQVAAKVAPALAAGCTMVLKPSELAPLSSILFAQIMHEAQVPRGVFNLVHGLGEAAGAAIARHPAIDMVSFTGSTRAGAEVSRNAAPSVKRVTLELGGKSANIMLDDAILETAVPAGIMAVTLNSGQTCMAPTRMLVPRRLQARVLDIAGAALESVVVGLPDDPATLMGPLSNINQFEKVNKAVQAAVDQGVALKFGGPGRHAKFSRGFFVKPTIFADVDNRAAIAQEEIFGPVLVVIPYDSEEEAVRIANDSPYGLAGFVQSADRDRATAIARQIEAGYIVINAANLDLGAPFGGLKRSGNGREWGEAGFEEYLEKKSIVA